MKYKLRFFISKGHTHSDCGTCFATIYSEHAPKKGQLVYLDDETIDSDIVENSKIYQVVRSVYVYSKASKSFEESKEGCISVEVAVKVTDL